ncbi:UNVERIFIED_ORG: hypothetical protein J2R93_004617 [Bradyrhizobium japonicum]
MLAEARHRGPRRHGAISTAGHDELLAFGDLDQGRGSARVVQLLAAAGWALRASRDIVLCDDGAGQVEACDVIAQISAKARGDCLGDLDGCEMDCGPSDGMVDERRYGDRTRRSPVKKPLDLPVADHAIEQASPARAFARFEHGPDQRKRAGRLHQQPMRLAGYAFLVQFGEPAVKIIVHQRDRELWRALGDLNAEPTQGRGQLLGAFDVNRLDLHGATAKILLRDFRRQAEACPKTADGFVECWRYPRNDISAIEEPLDRLLDLVGREALRKLANDRRPGVAMFSDRGGQGAVEFAVQEELAILGIEANRIGRQ